MYTAKVGDTVYLNKRIITKMVRKTIQLRRVDIKSGVVVDIQPNYITVEFKNKWRCYITVNDFVPLNEIRMKKIESILE